MAEPAAPANKPARAKHPKAAKKNPPAAAAAPAPASTAPSQTHEKPRRKSNSKPAANDALFAWSAFQTAPPPSAVPMPSKEMLERAAAVPEWIPKTLPRARILPQAQLPSAPLHAAPPAPPSHNAAVEHALASQLMQLLGVRPVPPS